MNNIDNTTYTTSNISNMLNDDKRKISAICKLNNEQLIAKFYSIYENIAWSVNSSISGTPAYKNALCKSLNSSHFNIKVL